MTISDILKAKLKEFEGCKLTAYLCPAGKWTIGVGHTKGVKKGQVITQKQADILLQGDLLPIITYLNGSKKDWTQGQFDACCDFCFNLGLSAFGGSTLWKYILLKKSTSEIQAQFKAWNKVKVWDKVQKKYKYVPLAGLTKRRNWEAQRWAE